MRGATNGKRRYYKDATSIDHDRVCASKAYLPQAKLEAEVVEVLHHLVETTPFETAYLDTQSAVDAAENRFKRARELYLGGFLRKEEVEKEDQRWKKAQKALQTLNADAILTMIGGIRSLATEYDSILPIKRRTLLHSVISAVFIQERALVALQLSNAFQTGLGGVICGPDGVRTRDLGLDRAAC